MARVIRFFIVLAYVMLPGVCIGGGTVSLAEIDSLLQQKPPVRNFLMSSLDMNSTVMAAVRFGSHANYLGGARMGPYIIQARPKSPRDASPLEVVLCTDARFFDASGSVTEDEMNAVRLEEKLTVVMLREVNSAPAIPSCP
jgi:Ran GTPase-activating protein (RanGAP) involved in mRNA processing and transport